VRNRTFTTIPGMLDNINIKIVVANIVDIDFEKEIVDVDKPLRNCTILKTWNMITGIIDPRNSKHWETISTITL
jgi:hypothetical protein